MTTIKHNGTTVCVPDSWGDITLEHYETFCAERPATAREQIALVAKICKVDADLLLGWPAEVFDRIAASIGFVFKDNPAEPTPCIEVDGVRYSVPMEDELTLGAWVDLDEVQRNGKNVMSNVLAIVCRPAGEAYDDKNNEARQAMFAALPVSKVLGVLAFFLQCKTALDRRTAAFTNLSRAHDRLPRNFASFLNRGDGIRSLQILRAVKYYALTTLLRYRLRRFLHTYCTDATKPMRKRRKGS